MAGTALLAVSVWNWDSKTLPGSGTASQGLATHPVLVTSLCLHGLLYAAVQLLCHCFTCWPTEKGQFVIIVSSGKRLYLWTESFTLGEIRYTTCGRQIQSWHILQHTESFLKLNKGMEFLPKGEFHLRRSQKIWRQAGNESQKWERRQKQEGREAGGHLKAVLVEGSSPCALGRTLYSRVLRPEYVGMGAQPSMERGLGRGSHQLKLPVFGKIFSS